MSIPICEICIDSVDGVVAAQSAGAHRVELCANLLEGGTTPSLGLMERAIRKSRIPVHVMIRPRGGDFLYSEDEVEIMLRDIAAAKSVGAAGLVFGCLTAAGEIDGNLTKRLASAARPLAVTFHRAFDMTKDPIEALDALVGLGIERVLTSGQEATALEGAPLIAELISRRQGQIIVMPGGGITSRNIQRVLAETGAQEIHFAALSDIDSKMTYRNPRAFMGGELRQSEYARRAATTEGVSAIMRAAAQS